MRRYVREAKGGYYCPSFLSMYIDSSENNGNLIEGEGWGRLIITAKIGNSQ